MPASIPPSTEQAEIDRLKRIADKLMAQVLAALKYMPPEDRNVIALVLGSGLLGMQASFVPPCMQASFEQRVLGLLRQATADYAAQGAPSTSTPH